jgi:hypothetical protein
MNALYGAVQIFPAAPLHTHIHLLVSSRLTLVPSKRKKERKSSGLARARRVTASPATQLAPSAGVAPPTTTKPLPVLMPPKT